MIKKDKIEHLKIFLDEGFLFFPTDIILQIKIFILAYIEFLEKDSDENMRQAIENLENYTEKIKPKDIRYKSDYDVYGYSLEEKVIFYNSNRYDIFRYLAKLLIRSYTDNHYPFLKQAVEYIPEFYRYKKTIEELTEEVANDDYGFIYSYTHQDRKRRLGEHLTTILSGESFSEYTFNKGGRKVKVVYTDDGVAYTGIYNSLDDREKYFKNYFVKKYKNYLNKN